MDRLLNVVAILSGALIVVVLTSLRRAHIRVEYSVSWLAAGIAMVVISQSTTLLDGISRLFGISEPPMAIMFIALSIFLIVFYRFSMIISELKDSNIALAQRVAILQYQVDSLHEERKTTDQG
jgi:hypothetical protein